MNRASVLVLGLVAACGSSEERAPTVAKAPPPVVVADAAPPLPGPPRLGDKLDTMPYGYLGPKAEVPRPDRKADPAFRLTELGSFRYRGRVADVCPSGTRVIRPDKDIVLRGTTLELLLQGGGCPQFTGYTVVPMSPDRGGPAGFERVPEDTLAYYVCIDVEHDPCEALTEYWWEFDLGPAMKAMRRTKVTFSPPTPVDPQPAAMCCCHVEGSANDVVAWPACQARGGTCDEESSCYGHEPDEDRD